MKAFVKAAGFWVATLLVTPALASYALRSRIWGRDRALEGSTQALGLVPGILGQFVRRAFLARALASCDPSATVEFGTLFSSASARLERNVYVGPRCHIGLVHIEADVLIGAGVHIPSGQHVHGTSDPAVPIREQEGRRTLVRIGRNSWIGSGAIVMADVGPDSIVGAGAVVVRAVPAGVVAAGVPARVIRNRPGAAEPAV